MKSSELIFKIFSLAKLQNRPLIHSKDYVLHSCRDSFMEIQAPGNF